MKKLLILFISVFLVSIYTLSSFASKTTSSVTNGVNQIILGSTNTVTVKLSAAVKAQYAFSTGGTSYSAATYSTKGNGKEYGLASDSSLIYYKSGVTDIDAGTNGNSSDVNSWGVLGH